MIRQWRPYLAGIAVLLVAATAIGALVVWWADLAALAGLGRPASGSGAAFSVRIDATADQPERNAMPITAGEWEWRAERDTSIARFAVGLLTVACDPSHQTVTFRRYGKVADTAAFTIRTSGEGRTLRGRKTGNAIAVTLAGSDPFLDAIALSRGRFGVEVAGLDPVYPGSWPELSRVVEDCRE
jgi:hypothetical protein